MRLTVNGIEIPDAQDGLNVLCELSGDEHMGPVRMVFSGGSLYIDRPASPEGVSVHMTVDPLCSVVLGESPGPTWHERDVTPDLIVGR
jgi:hypothetical protein